MQDLNTTPIPQWKIKYDKQFNINPQINDNEYKDDIKNSNGKFPWITLIISGLIILAVSAKQRKMLNEEHT